MITINMPKGQRAINSVFPSSAQGSPSLHYLRRIHSSKRFLVSTPRNEYASRTKFALESAVPNPWKFTGYCHNHSVKLDIRYVSMQQTRKQPILFNSPANSSEGNAKHNCNIRTFETIQKYFS